MPALSFSKWSPGGNTTLFFLLKDTTAIEQARLARSALDAHYLGGEQVGFVDIAHHRLRMAGGEFCVNASRAFGALLAYSEMTPPEGTTLHFCHDVQEYHYDVQVSGWQSPLHLTVRGIFPQWRVEAILRLPFCPLQDTATGITVVRLPGITHVLLDAALHSFPEEYTTVANQLWQELGLANEAAVGAVWWQKSHNQLHMQPLVYVRDAQSTYLESACGSGALALALCLSRMDGQTNFSIEQPSGSVLDVRLFRENGELLAAVDGPVTFVARGDVWLPDNAL